MIADEVLVHSYEARPRKSTCCLLYSHMRAYQSDPFRSRESDRPFLMSKNPGLGRFQNSKVHVTNI